jgi:FkbM family methyltransferase
VDALAAARALRHAPILERANWLWDRVRPAFDASLRFLYRRRGIVVEIGGGERMRADPRCRPLIWVGETEFREELLAELRPGDRFADVGASMGAYTVAAARRGAIVTSYEPHALTAELLRRNVELNGVADRVTVVEAAASETEGELPMLEMDIFAGGPIAHPSGTLRVRAVPLTGPFDVVKLDVEGHELEVLRGAAPLLRDPESRPRAIFVELHVGLLARFGGDPSELERLLPGYEVRRLGVRAATEHWVARVPV